jgi:di/tricarboxylate transporter
MPESALTLEMITILGLLAFTIFLFVSELVRVDVAAVIVLVILGLFGLIPPLAEVLTTDQLFAGFASNAVISIIAVMIIGAGLDKTGLMNYVAGFILRIGGSHEKGIIPVVAGTVGVISSFMQNVGAAALFLPVISRISARTQIPMSRLLMPMGFCAILGGTVTLVGSSPLILLNSLIETSNPTVEAAGQPAMETFGLFSVTPIGLALVAAGIAYFVLIGRYVLPANPSEAAKAGTVEDYLRETYALDYQLHEVHVPVDGSLADTSVGEVEAHQGIRVVAILTAEDFVIGPARDALLPAHAVLGVLGNRDAVERFSERYALKLQPDLDLLEEPLAPTQAGIAEVVIPPGSRLVGQTVRDVWMRKSYGLSVLAIHRGGETLTDDIREAVFTAGDTLITYNTWAALARIEHDRNFVVVTSDYPHEETRPHKVPHALVFFGIALSLILFTDLTLSVALLTGAVGMVVSRVLTMDEAYRAVDWKTVFLLASLIPLGTAVETTGTAAWIARGTLDVLGTMPAWGLQAVIAVLATLFSLVMSNVGATVLLVPLAVNIALAAQSQGIPADPAIFALTVGISTSNAFLIPTHQVNALIMGPGGYRVKDYLRAGGIMTVLFLIVELIMLNLLF